LTALSRQTFLRLPIKFMMSMQYLGCL